MKRIAILPFFLLILLVLPQESAAHHRKQVLGESTDASQLNLPPVTAGPGFLLPDSPLYFLDGIFQSIRVGTALGSENKVKVRAQIAGERLAELRIMISRNNVQGIGTALDQLTKETGLAAKDLTAASADGKDVTLLAKDLNNTIKMQRAMLNDLADQSNGALELQFKAAREVLKETKIEVEDRLPSDELENEIEEALEEEIEDEVTDADEAAGKIEEDLSRLNDQLQEASEKSLAQREEAIKKAIEEKNEELKREEENNLAKEKKKQEAVITTSKNAAEQARKAVKEAQEAAKKFEEAKSGVSEIKSSDSGSSGNDSSESDQSDDKD